MNNQKKNNKKNKNKIFHYLNNKKMRQIKIIIFIKFKGHYLILQKNINF